MFQNLGWNVLNPLNIFLPFTVVVFLSVLVKMRVGIGRQLSSLIFLDFYGDGESLSSLEGQVNSNHAPQDLW